MHKTIAMLFLLALCGCSVDEATFQRVMADEGYVDAVNRGWEPFVCGENDSLVSSFTATRVLSDGTRRNVSGTVCCGFLKNCTVRH